MIRAPQAPPSPREALAAALDGTLIGRDAIQVGPNVVWASVAGVLRVNRTLLEVDDRSARWDDDTATLAAAYRAAVGS